MKKNAWSFSRLLLVVGLVGAAHAQAQDSRFYLHLAAGKGDYSEGVGASAANNGNSGTASQFGVGYRLNQAVGLELAVFSFGDGKVREVSTPHAQLACSIRPGGCPALREGTVSVRSTVASVLLSSQLDHNLSVHGRLGLASTDRSLSGSVLVSTDSLGRKTEGLLGVGLGYQFLPNFKATLEWHTLSTTKMSMSSLGVQVSF